MSVLDLPLRKALQLFYASPKLRRKILKEDIRLDLQKESGGNRSQGGDFYQPFWTDVKLHMSGAGDISDLTAKRINSNKGYARLYPALRDGILDLINEKLRWSNERLEILPQSAHGVLNFEDLGGVIRIKNAFYARVRGEYTRVVYPYFSEEPTLPEEGGRLGLWAMQTALKSFDPNDMRLIDPLRKKFFSPRLTPLQGDEELVFRKLYGSLINDREQLSRE
jgi:hypothetical protein